ncbi:hypothetical protein [Candidatus Borreliella tachyglossi]|uniref:hypothetical protein n=1 Tax=Candidatus Borreliella tachyglossi TaxID=1964448 RepID=UPI004041E9AB
MKNKYKTISEGVVEENTTEKVTNKKDKTNTYKEHLYKGVNITKLMEYVNDQHNAGVDITIDYKHYLDFLDDYRNKMDNYFPFDIHFKDEHMLLIQYQLRSAGFKVGTKIIRDFAIANYDEDHKLRLYDDCVAYHGRKAHEDYKRKQEREKEKKRRIRFEKKLKKIELENNGDLS